MKSKNLPKRKIVNHTSSEEVRRHALKMNKQKRVKKPSIYDDMEDEEDYDDVYNKDYDRDDDYDYNYDKEDNEDYY